MFLIRDTGVDLFLTMGITSSVSLWLRFVDVEPLSSYVLEPFSSLAITRIMP